MSLFSWFKSKKPNYVFKEEDRDISADFRKKRAELSIKEMELNSKLKQAELELKLREVEEHLNSFDENDEEDFPEDKLNPDAMLMLLLTNIFKNNQQPQQPTQQQPPLKNNLTDEQIREVIKNLPPRAIKIAKGLDDDTLRTYIINQMPNIDDESIKRGITALREA